MPRFPEVCGSLEGIVGNPYSSLAARAASHDGERYFLNVGDTWLEPAVGCRMEDLRVERHPGMHRYSPPRGRQDLIDAIVDREKRRTGVATERANVLVTTGATGGLGAVMGAIVSPGDQVLVLAPYWPLITGIVRCFHGEPVAVPLLGSADSPEAAVALLRRHVTSRCVALYLSTPNNPTGKVIPPSWIEALVGWAARRDLWVVADDVYEDYVYEGEHASARAFAPERTFSSYSFSKAYGMAGNRCGYVLGPESTMRELCKVSTHAFYSAPTASQLAALEALSGRGDEWIRSVRPEYERAGRRAAERLGIEAPQGSTFLFLDVADALDERGLYGLLEDCAARGLLVAPGESFGPYPTHVRICFTCAPPDVVERGVDILAARLGR